MTINNFKKKKELQSLNKINKQKNMKRKLNTYNRSKLHSMIIWKKFKNFKT